MQRLYFYIQCLCCECEGMYVYPIGTKFCLPIVSFIWYLMMFRYCLQHHAHLLLYLNVLSHFSSNIAATIFSYQVQIEVEQKLSSAGAILSFWEKQKHDTPDAILKLCDTISAYVLLFL